MNRDQYYAARYIQRSDVTNPFRYMLPEHVKVMNRLSNQRIDLLALRMCNLGSAVKYGHDRIQALRNNLKHTRSLRGMA